MNNVVRHLQDIAQIFRVCNLFCFSDSDSDSEDDKKKKRKKKKKTKKSGGGKEKKPAKESLLMPSYLKEGQARKEKDVEVKKEPESVRRDR